MWPFNSLSKSYEPLKNSVDEEEEGESIDLDGLSEKRPQRRRLTLLATLTLVTICTVIAGVTYSSLIAKRTNPEDDDPAVVSEPYTTVGCTLRREWRTLSQAEKEHYISSVRCLTTIPSTIKSDWTSYEDFPWIHSHVGFYTHNSAPFLPWHRYFLHIYETTLREQCNFTGELVYWDWTQDWQHLENAPVFDAESGFGGDGDVNGDITVGNTGRCVVDGPFADIQAKYFDVKFKPHCLSRGFRDDEGNLGHMNGDTISPQSIEEVLQLDDYEAFVAQMESRVHDAIPFGIGGDFETFTAPYDPIFYLHHTQLDRLWYLWQQRDLEGRLMAYSGHNQRHSMEMAKLSDKIKMQSWAPEIEVKEVMDTEDALFSRVKLGAFKPFVKAGLAFIVKPAYPCLTITDGARLSRKSSGQDAEEQLRRYLGINWELLSGGRRRLEQERKKHGSVTPVLRSMGGQVSFLNQAWIEEGNVFTRSSNPCARYA